VARWSGSPMPRAGTPRYAVHAIRFCHREARRQDHFLEAVEEPGSRMPIDYFVWAVVGEDQAVLVDAGFTSEVSERRGGIGRRYLAPPLETLGRLGVGAEDLTAVTVSHLHYDHTGLLSELPHARVVVQRDELAFWCGPQAARPAFAPFCEPEDVAGLVARNLAGGVDLIEGEAEVVPGVTVHRVGGHTPGTQVVRVATDDGYVVLASDASHFYENLERRRPYALVHTLPAMYDAFDRVLELASDPSLVVPGHDPAVMERFPRSTAALDGLAVRIA
jgi:glyoxylase-like metal-dependent hydrolase (beta-lactamase superfamily II)